MGDHATGQHAVNNALALLLSHPEWTALQILDRAMADHEGTDAEFESHDPKTPGFTHPLYSYDDFPPSPFAEILRRAFAPDLDPREMLFAAQPDNDNPDIQQRIDQALDTWEQRVLIPFRTRYRLH